MSSIYSLLNLNEDVITNFHLQANSVADHQIEKVVNANMRRLKEIEDRMMTDCQIRVTAKSVDEVIKKVIRCANSKDTLFEDWTLSELRIVSYYIMKLQGDDIAYTYGLSLLDKNWKDLYFNGLVFYVLNGWNLMKKEYREEACQLIVKKLNSYNGNNNKYLLLKNHSNFFEEAGPLRMAALLNHKNIPLYNAPTLIGYKPSTFSLSYYSDVIIKTLCGQKFDDPDKIEELFEKHDSDRTKKMVFANFVEQADKNGNEFEQSQLSKFAYRMMGDISKSVTWTPFAGATDEEVSKLRRAKELVNQWYVRKVIEVFFEVCVQDHARKVFWTYYANQGVIKDFRIAGSTLVRQKMQNDDRVSNLFSRFFINTNSKYSQTAALILYIKNKVMVEFSDTGALYVYNRGNSMVGFIDKGKSVIGSVTDLKDTSIPLLVDGDYYYTYYYEEGRLNHRGEWEQRLRYWMQRKLFDVTNEDMPISSKDDEIFIAPPMPSQSPAPQYKESSSPSQSSRNDSDLKTQSYHSENTNKCMQQELDFTEDDEYELNIRFKMSSKWILGKFRVVCNYKCFYINIGNKFYPIKKIEESEQPDGNIWVKHPKYGWLNVVHFIDGKTYNIGYIKIEVTNLLYKERESDQSYKTIKL